MSTHKEWSTANTGSVKFNVTLNENGNIATTGQTAAGQKAISMTNIKSDAVFSDCANVYTSFLDVVGGRYDAASGEMTIKKKVVEVEDEVEP